MRTDRIRSDFARCNTFLPGGGPLFRCANDILSVIIIASIAAETEKQKIFWKNKIKQEIILKLYENIDKMTKKLL